MACNAVSFQSAAVENPLPALSLLSDDALKQALTANLLQAGIIRQNITVQDAAYLDADERMRLFVKAKAGFASAIITITKTGQVNVRSYNQSFANNVSQNVGAMAQMLAIKAIQAKLIQFARSKDTAAQVTRNQSGYVIQMNL